MPDFLNHVETGVQCSFFFAPSGIEIHPHYIEEGYEVIEMLTGGKVLWGGDGKTQVFGRGAIFWHQYGDHTVHRSPPGEPYRCGVWKFKVRPGGRPTPRIGHWCTPMDMDAFISDCINAFHSGAVAPDVIGLYSYGVLLRQMLAQGSGGDKAGYPTPLTKALALIEHNLTSALTVDYIATRCEVSKPYLFALFKKHLHIAPHQYILEQQLARARTMLASEALPIKEVAAHCGFDTLEVFYRQFRRACGMPPGEYRKRNSFYR